MYPYLFLNSNVNIFNLRIYITFLYNTTLQKMLYPSSRYIELRPILKLYTYNLIFFFFNNFQKSRSSVWLNLQWNNTYPHTLSRSPFQLSNFFIKSIVFQFTSAFLFITEVFFYNLMVLIMSSSKFASLTNQLNFWFQKTLPSVWLFSMLLNYSKKITSLPQYILFFRYLQQINSPVLFFLDSQFYISYIMFFNALRFCLVSVIKLHSSPWMVTLPVFGFSSFFLNHSFFTVFIFLSFKISRQLIFRHFMLFYLFSFYIQKSNWNYL